MISFDKIVNKLYEKKWNILTILDIQDTFYSPDEKGRIQAYKVVSRLKKNGILLPIRHGIFYVKKSELENIVDIIDENYWKIVRAIISEENLGQSYFISGIASLHIHMRIYSAPDTLTLYTNEITKNIKITPNSTIKFSTISTWKSLKNTNAYNRLSKFVMRVELDGISMRIATRELALLEWLSHGKTSKEDMILILKFLKKFEKTLDLEILGKLVSVRYITAINRLREIAKNNGFERLYAGCIQIIAREWKWCFLTVG